MIRRALRPLRMSVLLVFLFAGAAMTEAHSPVADAPDAVSPLLIGAEVPNVEVTTLDGEPVLLGDFLEGDPAVIVFFRGAW